MMSERPTDIHAPTPTRFRNVAVLTPYGVERMHLNDAADEIERLQAEIERLRIVIADTVAWQLIDTASKDDGVAVLLWDGRDVFTGYWEASCDFWAVSDGGCAIPVPTHWMPMPKPPAV